MDFWYWLSGLLPCDWAQFTFMQNALLAVLLASPLFAMLGCMVINSQMAFFSDVVGHAALTGIAIGAILGLADPTASMLVFAILLAIAVVVLRRYSASSTDTVIGLVMAFAVALGVVLLSRGGGFGKYSRYLIGDILTITPGEIARLILLLLVVTVVWTLFYNRILLVTLHRPLARSRGVAVWTLECLFAVMIAVVVTVCIPWIGLLVINSLILLPAAASRNFARNSAVYFWGAIAVSLVAGVAGLIGSYYWATATGATIVLFAMGLFLLTLPFRSR